MDKLLQVDSRQVRFNFEIGRKAFDKVRIRNLMHTMPVAFRVLTTSPGKYGVQPQIAIIPPLGETCLEVVMLAQQHLPGAFPVSNDKLFVKSMLVPTGKATEKELNQWFTTRRKHVFTDAVINVVFTGSVILRNLATSGCSESIMEVIKDTDVDNKDKQDRTALHIASVQGNLVAVKALVEAGANVNVKNKMGQTPLSEASSGGHTEIVKILLAAGADTEARNPKGWTPLHAAAAWNWEEALGLLLEAGANKDATDDLGRTPLHEAVVAGNVEVVKALLQSGADTRRRCLDGWTALHCAAKYGRLEIVDLLIAKGANPEARNHKGKIPYDLALENGYYQLLDPLHLQQMLQKASREGDLGRVRDCLLLGASPHGKDQHGWTALHRACFKGHLDIVRLLLKHEADINSKDDEGYTPLHCSVETGRKEVVQHLLQHGADINVCTNKGWTPLSLAAAMKYLSILQILEERTEQEVYTDKSSIHVKCISGVDKFGLHVTVEKSVVNVENRIVGSLSAAHRKFPDQRIKLKAGLKFFP